MSPDFCDMHTKELEFVRLRIQGRGEGIDGGERYHGCVVAASGRGDAAIPFDCHLRLNSESRGINAFCIESVEARAGKEKSASERARGLMIEGYWIWLGLWKPAMKNVLMEMEKVTVMCGRERESERLKGTLYLY